MSDVTATYAIVLGDEVSGSAQAAAASLDELRNKINEDVKELRNMQRALRNLKAAKQGSSAAAKALKARIDEQKASIGKAQEQYIMLGGTFKDKVVPEAARTGSAIKELTGALGEVGGPLGNLGNKISRFASLLTNPVVLVGALTVGILAMAGATVAVIGTLGRYAIAQSGARREEALRIEGLNTLNTWMGRVSASTSEMQAAIDRASDSTIVGRGQLQTYSRQLARMGIRGQQLTSALEAMAVAQQVQGDRGAARFRAQIANARATGRSVDAVAESYRRRLGPIARRQMLSLTNQSIRLRRSLERIFSGLRIESFLEQVGSITEMFSQSTSEGRALKAMVEAIFQPMIDSVTTLGPMVRAFFQGVVIGALILVITLQRVGNAISSAFGGTNLNNAQLLEAATIAGAVAVGAMVIAFVGLAAVLGTVAATMATLTAMVFALPTAIATLVAAVTAGGAALAAFVSSIDFEQLGLDMLNGLARGINSGVSTVTDAVRGVASSAQETFRQALGIRSPSRVFAGFGAEIPRGIAMGIEDTAPVADRAVEDVAGPPPPSSRVGSTVVSFGDINVGDVGDRDPRDVATAIRDELASILEGVNIELGASST